MGGDHGCGVVIDGVKLALAANGKITELFLVGNQEEIQSALARSQQLPRVEVTGMALPILRETEMTTLHIEHGAGSPEALEELALVISRVIDEVIHRQA